MNEHQKVLTTLSKDRRLAHAVLFKHRHPLATPDFHGEMIDDFHNVLEPNLVDEAFRGGGKSTIGEEATVIGGCFTDFANCVIVSSTERRAAERLEAIKHEIETNDLLHEIFGDQTGAVWQANKIVLQNGVCIQALGVGQSVRGIKYHDFRPDFLWIDDIEDEESVKSPDACQERLRWLYGTLLPVCAKGARIRVTGNRLSPDAVVAKLAVDPAWKSRRYPISRIDLESGKEVATWPELHDILWIRSKRDEYERLGLDGTWASEYMCEAISAAVKPFKPENIVVFPRVKTWEAVYAMYDPAKTTKSLRHQAFTGKAVWSWVGRKLVIWDAIAKPWMPSELINDIFQVEKDYQPIAIRVEADGLEEWLNEPLRMAQLERRTPLPHLGAERAPRDKDGFIRALQPHFISNEVEFAKDLPDLRAQILNFPSGRKDALNALAYALKLRPGQPVYDAFTQENIAEDLEPSNRSKNYLCLNADGAHTTGVLVQFDGTLSILADWIEGPDPGTCIEIICKQAQLAAGGKLDIIVPPKEMDHYLNKGVVAALRRVPRGSTTGTDPKRGRGEVRDLLERRGKRPLILVSDRATWSLRALAGGFHTVVGVRGAVDGEPATGAYRTLMEGLESFAGIMHHDEATDEEVGIFRTSRSGERYRSLVPNR